MKPATDAGSGGRTVLSFFTRVIPRRATWIDVAVLLFVGLLIFGVVAVARQWRAPLQAAVEIDLSLSTLPRYTLFSLCRGLVAFVLSFLFTLVYGYVAARVRHADKVMIPLLDILQSIPVLGFMPGVVLALAALFPTTNLGLELAAVVMIFTGQVWNMTFSFYHSLRSIPPDLLDAGRIYRFGWWRRFRAVELPYATVGLVWNGMMSMAGGWFFLTVNESFRLGDRDFRLPGLGAYMSVAIDKGDPVAMAGGVGAMVVMIVVVDQVVWRPLVAWSERFKLEDVGASTVARSWLLDVVRRSNIYVWLGKLHDKLRQRVEVRERRRPSAPVEAAAAAARSQALARAAGYAVLLPFAALCIWGTVKLARLLAELDVAAWARIARASAYTFLRTTAAVVIGTLWAVPAGLYIGRNPRASRFLQPIVQVAASFPAPMIFPLVLLVLDHLSGRSRS